jgi:hypothetical protein
MQHSYENLAQIWAIYFLSTYVNKCCFVIKLFWNSFLKIFLMSKSEVADPYSFLQYTLVWYIGLRYVGSFKPGQGTGNDVMIFKIFLSKNSAKKLAFLTQNKAKLCKILNITLVFEKNANLFAENCQKSQKIVITSSTLICWHIFYDLVWNASKFL